MQYQSPLKTGKFLKRYKRFFADIEVDGEIITAHCPNTGSLKGLKEQPASCRFSMSDDPKRKLKATLEMIKTKSSWVGVNTGLPNRLVKELWENKTNKSWAQYDRLQGEVKISDKSRIDIVMWNEEENPGIKKLNFEDVQSDKYKLHLIEIKNVTLADGNSALFPDAVTERGQKHIRELMELMDRGYSCELVFTIQREDCDRFSPAEDIDPDYAELLRKAHKKGLIVSALPCKLTDKSVELLPTPLKLEL